MAMDLLKMSKRSGCPFLNGSHLKFPFNQPLMYQSIPSLAIPGATPGDSHVLTARGGGVFAQLSLPGGSGF